MNANAIAITMTEILDGEGVKFTLPVTFELLDMNGEPTYVIQQMEDGYRDHWHPSENASAAAELRIHDHDGHFARFTLLDGCARCE